MNDYNNCKNGSIKNNHEFNTTSFNQNSILKNNNNMIDTNVRKEVRGRKTFVFWTLICLLVFLALGNLILTFTILGVLRLGYGMNSLELIPEALAIKFYGNTDLGHVYKVDGKINGFSDTPMEIKGDDNGSIYLNLVGRNGRPINKLSMDRNGTIIHNIDNFVIRGANENKLTFFNRNPHFNLRDSVNSLKVKLVHSNRIVSLNNSSLEIKADSHIHLRGAEGTRMESKKVTWSADQNIVLKSVNGSIILSGIKGVSIDLKNIPISMITKNDAVITQYKLCVCIPHGKLFRLPVLQGQTKINCNHVKMIANFNPCI